MILKEIEIELLRMFFRIRRPEVFNEDFELLFDLLFEDLGRGRRHSRMIFDRPAPEAKAFRLEGYFQGRH